MVFGSRRANIEYCCVVGLLGQKGTPGTPGRNGIRGQPGLPGVVGERGPDGRPGAEGRPGQPGRPGREGYNGLPGTVTDGGSVSSLLIHRDTNYKAQNSENLFQQDSIHVERTFTC